MANVDYINNPNQRTPCVLVLDASHSMSQQQISGSTPIDELNMGIVEFAKSLKEDASAFTRVQLSVVCVGGPRDDASILMDWTDCSSFEPFKLKSAGGTPLAEGVLLALSLVESAKSDLKNSGVSYTRPWIFVISDGEPTSTDALWRQAISQIQSAQREQKVEVFAIAVKGANVEKLSELSIRPVVELEGVKFREMFVWLTGSLSAAAKSRPGDRINLPPTDPWRNVGV